MNLVVVLLCGVVCWNWCVCVGLLMMIVCVDSWFVCICVSYVVVGGVKLVYGLNSVMKWLILLV